MLNKTNFFKKSSEKKKEIDLSNEYFPQLNDYKLESENTGSEMKKSVSYVDKLNQFIEEEKTNEYILKPGWVKITIDKNNKIFTEINKITTEENNYNINLFSLVDKWEKYEKNYISLNGEDSYNYYHKFQNHDYEYFERLDELEELKELEELNKQKELLNDSNDL
jgi:hypothetical protein